MAHVTYFGAPPATVSDIGLYTPVFVLGAAGWLAALTDQWSFSVLREGSTRLVTVNGVVEITADGAEPSTLTITLPVAPGANWVGAGQLAGVYAPEGGSGVYTAGAVIATVGAQTASAGLTSTGAGAANIAYSFTYRIV